MIDIFLFRIIHPTQRLLI